MVNGYYHYPVGLSGARSKAKRAEEYNLPPGTPAGKDYFENVYLPQQAALQAGAAAPANGAAPATNDSTSLFGFDLPKKFLGQPTWMWLIGGALFGMTMLKGGSKRK
jgi:hypothetical protein